MIKIIKYFFVLLAPLFLFNSTFGQSKLTPNRFYLEGGTNKNNLILLSQRTKYKTQDIWDENGKIAPLGGNLAFVVGSPYYQAKLGLLVASWRNDYNNLSANIFYLMVGKVKHYRWFAFAANAGLGLQSTYVYKSGGPIFNDYVGSGLGLISELEFQFLTPFAGITPFSFGFINQDSYSLGIGLKLSLGKVGYLKKRFEP